MINTKMIFSFNFFDSLDLMHNHFVMLTAGFGKFKVKLAGGPGPHTIIQ